MISWFVMVQGETGLDTVWWKLPPCSRNEFSSLLLQISCFSWLLLSRIDSVLPNFPGPKALWKLSLDYRDTL